MIDSAIADSTCLIVLDKIGRLDILLKSFPRVIAPPAVLAEVGRVPAGVVVSSVRNKGSLSVLRLSLGEGESEVIALATDYPSSILILDDLKARRVAERLSLRVMGTIGMVTQAKLRGLVEEVAPILADMKAAGFHMSEEIRLRALSLAGER